MKRRLLKRINPGQIYTKEDQNGEKEFYFYKYRNGSRKNYTYRVVYLWDVWKKCIEKIGLTWENLGQNLQICLYAHGGIEFKKLYRRST